MAAFNKINAFPQNVFNKAFDFSADTFKVALSNTAPTSASTVWNTTNFPAPAAANGYTAGGNTLSTTSSTQTSGTYRWIVADSVFTATAGGIGPFRYAIIYHSVSGDVIGWYDYGSAVTLSNPGDTLTVDFDNVNGVLSMS